MREKRSRSPDDSENAYKRGRRNDYDDYDEELEEIDSQATLSGKNEEEDRTSTTMMLAQRTPSFELPDRQASGGGYSWSLDDSEHSREVSPEINILDYLPGHDPVQSVVGLPIEEARRVCTEQERARYPYGVNRDRITDDQNHTTFTPPPDHQPSYSLPSISTQNSTYSEGPNRQPSEEYLVFNLTQSTGPNRSNTGETVVPPYQYPRQTDSNTQTYFFTIEDYNLPEDIYNKPFDKSSKTLETNIIDLDFSDVLPVAGLFSIIMYSYI